MPSSWAVMRAMKKQVRGSVRIERPAVVILNGWGLTRLLTCEVRGQSGHQLTWSLSRDGRRLACL